MKTVIYNIGTLAGILPADVRKLEGSQMNTVECIENAYLVIEDGIIAEFGACSGGEVPGITDSGTESLPLRGPLPFTRPRAATVPESVMPGTSYQTTTDVEFIDDDTYMHPLIEKSVEFIR